MEEKRKTILRGLEVREERGEMGGEGGGREKWKKGARSQIILLITVCGNVFSHCANSPVSS